MDEHTEWVSLTIDPGELEQAWTTTGRTLQRAILSAPADPYRPVLIGDALLAAFHEGVKFAVGSMLAQTAEAGAPVKMEALDLEGDLAGFNARYGTSDADATR